MVDLKNATAEDLKNPDYVPPLGTGITLGLQHVLAMFVSNFTPAIIIGGAAGFAFGSADAVFLIQMSMLFAGIATLFQNIGMGPIGARLPVSAFVARLGVSKNILLFPCILTFFFDSILIFSSASI